MPVPKNNEILIRVHATTVNRTDCATIKGIPFFARIITGLFKPRKPIPGSEFSGEIEAVGKNIKNLKEGDKVFGFNDQGADSHAQFLTITEDKVDILPANLTYLQAAASVEGAHYAYNFINKINIKEGQSVIVNGASGAIGSAAVQLLKYFGADVTAVCSTKNLDLVKSIGADKVIDYTKEDFTKIDKEYHFVFDMVGKSSFFACKHLLKHGGVYISSDLGYLAQNLYLPMITAILKPLLGNKKIIFPMPVNIKKSIQLIKKMIEEGKFTAVIDREYPFEAIIDAYQYVEKGHKIGNVVINMDLNAQVQMDNLKN